jgi:hypothetical protein
MITRLLVEALIEITNQDCHVCHEGCHYFALAEQALPRRWGAHTDIAERQCILKVHESVLWLNSNRSQFATLNDS